MLENSLRNYIEQHGIRKKWLADKAGISYYCLIMSLNGKRDLRANEAIAICRALGLSMDKFSEDDHIAHEEASVNA